MMEVNVQPVHRLLLSHPFPFTCRPPYPFEGVTSVIVRKRVLPTLPTSILSLRPIRHALDSTEQHPFPFPHRNFAA